MLSRNVMLSCQALSRSAQVVSQRPSGVAAARRNLGTSNGELKMRGPGEGNCTKNVAKEVVPLTKRSGSGMPKMISKTNL